MPPNTSPAKWLIVNDKHKLLSIPWGNARVVISGVHAMSVHPIGISYGLHLTCMHLMSVHCIGMYLIGVYRIGAYPIGVDVTGIYFKGVLQVCIF
jgi:hypothetical protein